jgi:hypothetical protein
MAYEKSSTGVLTDYPLYYPQHLVAETHVIIGEAVEKFPTLDLILPLIQHVVVRMTPVMMRETSGVREDLVLLRMGALVDSILVQHFGHDRSKGFDLKQVILDSDEWQALAKAVVQKCAARMPEKPQDRTSVPAAAAPGPIQQIIHVNNRAAVYTVPPRAKPAKKRKRKPATPRVQEPAPAKPAADKATLETESANEVAPPATPTKGRHADVEIFKKQILAAEGYNPTYKDIRIVAGRSQDPRSLEYFQYNITVASKPAIEVYDAVLKMEPTEFMRKLRQLKPESKPKHKARR